MGARAIQVSRPVGMLQSDEKVVARRARLERTFITLALAALVLSLGVLALLLLAILGDGFSRLSWQFLTSYPSRRAAEAGIFPALFGSFGLIILTVAIALPLGVGAAIYLEEYAPKTRFTRFIELTIINLAGVPSIIFGLLGLQLFVRYMGFGRSLIAGSLTMALLALPVIVMATREALRAVPKSLRDASLALGATRSQTIRIQILPVAFPGILTGCILAMSRVVGETAPLVTIGALTYVAFLPTSIFDAFTVLPIQTFNWLSRPQAAFQNNAAAAIIVLLVVLVLMNASAIYLRDKLQKRSRF